MCNKTEVEVLGVDVNKWVNNCLRYEVKHLRMDIEDSTLPWGS